MKQVITAKLKLLTTAEQFKALRQTQLAYRDALNAVSRYAKFLDHDQGSSIAQAHLPVYLSKRFTA